jgi:hypothetical protein
MELTSQKLLEAHRNVAITIGIILLEYVRHALETNTTLDEKVEGHGASLATIIYAVHMRHETRG